MSIEIFVFSDRRLASIEEWQQALDKEGFGLRLDTSRPIAALRGHLPAHRGEQEAGFECDHFDAAEMLEHLADVDLGRRWTQCLAFRFGGNFFALWGANAAAAAYARATGGVVFDSEADEVLQPDEAAALAREVERQLPE
jgi:hypothetical protein